MRSALLKLHTSVLLAGLTGVLGALISLNAGLLVWYRISITIICLVVVLKLKKQDVKLSLKHILKLMCIGFLIALHWVLFYASIKVSNVSIGLICFASVGLFTALFEPLFTGKKIQYLEVMLGCISLLGIYIIFHFDTRYRIGIVLGIGSSLLAAIFSVLNKKNIHIAVAQNIMLYELSGGLLLLTAIMPFYLKQYPAVSLIPSRTDWVWLFILAILCTVLAMDLMLQALKKVSAFTQNLTLNLEPVYGIILAFLVFNENKFLDNSFYIGFAFIAFSVIIQMLIITKKNYNNY